MTLKTAVAIRHVAFEDLGAFAPVLERAGYKVHYYDVGVDELWTLEPVRTELVIVLGGPIGAYDEARYPFIADEINLLEARLATGKPTIGICLGAQLMARALGARVYPGPAKEIGFAPLRLTGEGKASCLSVFNEAPVLHWHGDTFDLPDGATRLASTALCDNQAFAYGRGAIGFQFHPEVGGDGFERWLIGHACELDASGVDVVALRAENEKLGAAMKARAQACLETWLGPIEA